MGPSLFVASLVSAASESDPTVVPTILTAVIGVVTVIILPLLAWSLSKNVRSMEGTINTVSKNFDKSVKDLERSIAQNATNSAQAVQNVHNDVLAVKSDMRVAAGDAAKAREMVAGAAVKVELLAEAHEKLDEKADRIFREGCAHRSSCTRKLGE